VAAGCLVFHTGGNRNSIEAVMVPAKRQNLSPDFLVLTPLGTTRTWVASLLLDEAG